MQVMSKAITAWEVVDKGLRPDQTEFSKQAMADMDAALLGGL